MCSSFSRQALHCTIAITSQYLHTLSWHGHGGASDNMEWSWCMVAGASGCFLFMAFFQKVGSFELKRGHSYNNDKYHVNIFKK